MALRNRIQFVCLLLSFFGAGFLTSADTVTGITVFSTESSGNETNGQLWTTLNAGTPFNLFLSTGSNTSPAFVNTSGDVLSIPLTPGTYTYTLWGNPGVPENDFGINIFFNSSSRWFLVLFSPVCPKRGTSRGTNREQNTPEHHRTPCSISCVSR